ncbi:MAG: transcriptional regulator [Halobacteria archaeon]
MRDRVLDDATRILKKGGFAVSDTCNIRPKSFDVVARRGDLVLLLKVLVNIDGLDTETAAEMRALAAHLDAKSIIVGVKTRDHELEDGVLYLRRGVPAMSRGTAHDYFVEGVPPLVYMGSGGLYVNIDGELLEDARDDEDMSLGKVADELGVSRRAVSKYEDGMDATLDVALRLEDMFGERLISPVEVFDDGEGDEDEGTTADEPVDETERRVFAILRNAGFDVVPTARAPFRALSRESDETVLTGTGARGSDIVKRARLMSSISDVARTESVYVVDDKPARDSVEETAILEVEDLENVDGSDDLLSRIEG